jgi:anti-anti-sigma factor
MNAFSGPGLSVSLRSERGCVIAALSGELDITCVPALREQLLGLLRPGAGRLVVDLSRVSYADASGLAVLVGTGRLAGLLGGFLRLGLRWPGCCASRACTGSSMSSPQSRPRSPARGVASAGRTAQRTRTWMPPAARCTPNPRPGKPGEPGAPPTPVSSARRSPPSSCTPTRGATPTPTASSLPPCTPWPAPMPAPATPLWPRRRSPSCPSSPVSPSPTPRRSQLPPAVFAAFSTPIGGPHSPETTHRATAWSGSSPPVSALTVNGKSGREGRARDHLRRSDHLTGISKRHA